MIISNMCACAHSARIKASLTRCFISQVIQRTYTDVEENHLRMVEICNNHPMFQFLFDENGKLLAANKRALVNMKGAHNGSQDIARNWQSKCLLACTAPGVSMPPHLLFLLLTCRAPWFM